MLAYMFWKYNLRGIWNGASFVVRRLEDDYNPTICDGIYRRSK